MKGDAATVMTTLRLLDARVKGKLSLPDGRRTGKRSGLEPNIQIGFKKGDLKKENIDWQPCLKVSVFAFDIQVFKFSEINYGCFKAVKLVKNVYRIGR